jgi:hypothetical protein
MHHQMQQPRYIRLKNMAFAGRCRSILVHIARFALFVRLLRSEGCSAPQYRGVALRFQEKPHQWRHKGKWMSRPDNSDRLKVMRIDLALRQTAQAGGCINATIPVYI